MRITSAGDVGIGTTTPAAKLDVNGSIKSDNQVYAGKNFVINGGMDIWQRGTSFTNGNSTSTYGADRYLIYSNTSTGRTWSRQTTGDTTNLPSIQYCLRAARNSGDTQTNGIFIQQPFESANSIPLAGKTVVFSFYARAGANFSATSNAFGIQLITGTGTDQNSLTGFTGVATPINSSVTLTTTWQRFTSSVTLGGTITQLAVQFGYTPTGTAGANDYFEVTGIQVEAGSVATQFSRAGTGIGGELALCQRYYYRITPDAATRQYGSGMAYSTTQAVITIPYPVTMRTRPTAVEQSGTAADYATLRKDTNLDNLTAVLVFYSVTSNTQGVILTVSTNLVAGNATALLNNNTNGYIGWSAEL